MKALHKFIDDIILHSESSVIGVCSEKDTEPAKKIGGYAAVKSLKDVGFEDMSTRPSGQKNLPYLFGTMIRIGLVGDEFVCQIVGDRGHRTKDMVIKYGKDLKSAIDKFRSEN